MRPRDTQSDISGAREPFPIPLKGLSDHDIANLTETFHTYVTDSVYPDGTALDAYHGSDGSGDGDVDEFDVWGCDCAKEESSCSVRDSDICECVANHGNFYTAAADSSPILHLAALPPHLALIECGASCHCSSKCSNRLTQGGVHVPMTISPTPTGIGVSYSPLHSSTLPTGTFISLYAGEYLSTDQARQRWADTANHRRPGQGNYILSLRLPNEVIHIDPRHIGNVGRFLNHSCDPNCIIEVVKWGPYAPARAAIFTKRGVHEGEELTFDYGDASGQANGRDSSVREVENGVRAGTGRTKCLCGTTACRGYMPYDETL